MYERKYDHVGRPTCEEKNKRNKKIVIKVFCSLLLFLIGIFGIYLFINREFIDFSSLMGDFTSKRKVSGKVFVPLINKNNNNNNEFLYTNNAYETYSIVSKLGTSSKIMQNFVVLKNRTYITQENGYITRVSLEDTTKQKTMNFGESFGHMDAIDFETRDGSVYLWTGCDAKLNQSNRYFATKICRIKLNSNLLNVNNNDYSFISKSIAKTDKFGTKIEFDGFDVSVYDIVNKFSNLMTNINGFAIDDKNRLIVLRTGSDKSAKYLVFDLDEFVDKYSNKKVNIKPKSIFEVNNSQTDLSFQGLEIDGYYIYVYEGRMSPKGSNPNGIYLSAYSWKNSNNKKFNINNINNEKGIMYYRTNIGYPDSTEQYVFEPEGISIYKGVFYAGFAVIKNYGEKNEQRTNVIYKLKSKN